MKKKWNILLILAVILVLVVSIVIYKNITKENTKEDNNFKIVTTFYPIYIMAENITQGAKNVDLINMTDINVGCLHDYNLSTTDMKKIENADLIIQNGLGLENFMDKILNTYSDIKIVDSSSNITNKVEENGEINNHIWTSISNYIAQVEEIANGLTESNPENANIYEQNKNNYIEKLENLQSKYETELSNLKGKKAICLNEAFTYLTKEVGMESISVQTNHDESSLSAEKMKNLISQMKNENIDVIIVDSDDNLQTAQTLSKETEAKILKLKSGLTGETNKDAYIQLMNENLEILKTI